MSEAVVPKKTGPTQNEPAAQVPLDAKNDVVSQPLKEAADTGEETDPDILFAGCGGYF